MSQLLAGQPLLYGFKSGAEKKTQARNPGCGTSGKG
jgi:hypothetical protein